MMPLSAAFLDGMVLLNAGRRYFALWLLFALLLLATRLPVLWTSTFIYRGAEEQARGILPLHLDQGLLMPFQDYQFDEYNGGGMVIGLLAYPFFHRYGPTYLSLKIPALLISLVLFTLLFVFARRYFGIGVAVAMSLLFLFAPAHYLERSLIAYGNHMELATFVAAGLLLFMAIQQGARSPGTARRGVLFGALGLVLGFGFYFMYEILSFVAVLALVYAATARQWRFVLMDGLCFAAGFYVGFLPWMFYHHDFLVLDYFWRMAHESPPDKVGSFNHLGLFIKAITVNVADWFGAHDLTIGTRRVPGGVFNALFLAVFAGSYFYLVWQHRARLLELARGWWPRSRQPLAFTAEHALLPLLLYVPLHLLVYGKTRYRGVEPLPPTRYLLVLFPAYFLLVAVTLRDLWTNRRRWLALLMLLAVGVASIGGNAHYLQGARPGEPLRRPGYSYQYFMEMLERQYHVRWKFDYQWSRAERVFPEQEGQYTAGAASAIAFLNGRRIDGQLRFAAQSGSYALAAFVAGLGLGPHCTDHVDPDRLAQLDALVPPEYRPWYEYGRQLDCPPPR